MSFQKDRFKKILATSLFLHLFIGVFFLSVFYLHKNPSSGIEIVSIQIKKTKPSAHKKTIRLSKKTSRKHKSKFRQSIQVYSQGELATFSHSDLSGRDGYEIQKEISIETDSLIYPFLKKLHDKISNSISYPEKLVKKNETGIITAQFDIDSKGKLIGKPLVSYSENEKLRLFLVSALEKTLSRPLDPHSRLPMKKIRIVTRFDFKVFAHENSFPTQNPLVVKNVLNFYKYAARNNSIIQAGIHGSTGGVVNVDPFQILESENDSTRL